MDQFPNELIETIFSYLIDYKLLLKHNSIVRMEFETIANLRLVCRRFLASEYYLIKNLRLGPIISEYAYLSALRKDDFWYKNLPYVRHLDLYYFNKDHPLININKLDSIESLDIFESVYIGDLSRLTQLKQLFCPRTRTLDISKLTKTNIHYHFSHQSLSKTCVKSEILYGNLCRHCGCLIIYYDNRFI